MTNKAGSWITRLIENIHLILAAFLLALIIIEVISKAKEIYRFWRTRHLRKVWGIKNGDHVSVVCSELDNADERQRVEAREFIYNLKYGDIDAYFEVIVTLLRLFPKIKLRILSSGEAESTRVDVARHIILIGGPDYNSFVSRVIKKQITQIRYKAPDLAEQSTLQPDEIVLYNSTNEKEYYELTDEKDYGYFERIQNPDDPRKNIILIGGCHTIGVTGAAKAFSMAESEQGEIPDVVLKSAQLVAGKISEKTEYSVSIAAERDAQTIKTPIVKEENISVKE